MTNAALIILFAAGLVLSLTVRRFEAHPIMSVVDAALTVYFIIAAITGRGSIPANVILAVVGVGATVRSVRASVLRRRGRAG